MILPGLVVTASAEINANIIKKMVVVLETLSRILGTLYRKIPHDHDGNCNKSLFPPGIYQKTRT
ncbi:MAG: hypothetical protein WCP46_01630 [Alphaproteobacteria bacterium]